MTAWNDMPSAFQSAFSFVNFPQSKLSIIQNALIDIYNNSEFGMPLINTLLAAIENTQQGDNPPIITINYSLGDPVTYQATHTINIGTDIPVGYINNYGSFVKYSLDRALYHELVHAIYGDTDGPYASTPPDLTKLTGQNSPIDLMGPTVERENAFAASFYSPSDINSSERSSYLAGVTSRDVRNLESQLQNTAWTEGTYVDDVIVAGTNTADGSTIDLSNFGDRQVLTIAFASGDTIYGSDGGNYIWTTAGNNTIRGGAGNDVVHSGTNGDVITGSSGDDRIYGAGKTTLTYGDFGPTTILLDVDQSGASSITIDKGQSGTDEASGIGTLTLTSNRDNIVLIDGTPFFANGLNINNGSSQTGSTAGTVDLSTYAHGITSTNGAAPAIGANFSGFDKLIGTAQSDVFNFINWTSSDFVRIEGGGGADTFNVNYGAGSESPLLLVGGTASDNFEFKQASNSSFTLVWGGGGGDVFNFDQSATVVELSIQGLNEMDLMNLDIQGVETTLSQWGLPSDAIVIINPTQDDKIQLNGKAIGSAAYNIVSENSEQGSTTLDPGYQAYNPTSGHFEPTSAPTQLTETRDEKDYGFTGDGFLYKFLGQNSSRYNPDGGRQRTYEYGGAVDISSIVDYNTDTTNSQNGGSYVYTSSSYTTSDDLFLIGFQAGDFGIGVTGDGPSYEYNYTLQSDHPEWIPNGSITSTGQPVLGSQFFSTSPFGGDPQPTIDLSDYLLSN